MEATYQDSFWPSIALLSTLLAAVRVTQRMRTRQQVKPQTEEVSALLLELRGQLSDFYIHFFDLQQQVASQVISDHLEENQYWETEVLFLLQAIQYQLQEIHQHMLELYPQQFTPEQIEAVRLMEQKVGEFIAQAEWLVPVVLGALADEGLQLAETLIDALKE